MPFDKRTIESAATGTDNYVSVFVPDVDRPVFPVMYFLHGLGDNSDTVWEKTGLYALAEEHELIIVSADAESGWYCNDRRDGRNILWEDFFAFELPSFIEENYPASKKRRGRGLCGFSMGGYGALMLALRHGGRFAAASSISGSVCFGHEFREDRPERTEFMKAVAPPGGEYDLFAAASSVSESASAAGDGAAGASAGVADIPSLMIEVGLGDHLLEHNRRLRAHLDVCGIGHVYAEHEGGHDWTFVGKRLHSSMDFLTRELPVF